MIRWSFALCLVAFAGCKCASPSLGPLEDPKPASLGATGLLVEQPAEGAQIDADWVTVSGWVDRSHYASVAVVGAASTSFYAAGGHSGIPTVPVMVREDGRWIAPRVPLEKGSTEVLIIAITSEGTVGAQEKRTVSTAALGSPVTIVVSPPEGGRAPLSASFEPHAAKKVDNWQWDYDGDGHFDEEKPTGSHRFETAGSYLVFARTKIDGLWVWGVAPVQVSGEDDITHSSTQVTNPRAIVVVPRRFDYEEWDSQVRAGLAQLDPTSLTWAVLVLDGDVVKVFDAQLNLVRTVSGGLNAPAGATLDRMGRMYVADTGNNRVVRFTPEGALDPTFYDAGVLAIAAGGPVSQPTMVLVDHRWDEFDGGIDIDLTITTPTRAIDCEKLKSCFNDPNYAAQKRVVSEMPFGGPSGKWLLRGGKLLRDDDLSEQSTGTDALDAALDLGQPNPWWAVLKPGGRLEERYARRSNTRVTRLGFDATAIATDSTAEEILADRFEREQRISGQHVIYIAGPGRLERRVLPRMAEGLW